MNNKQSNGRVLIGVSAEVILDRNCCLILYRGEDGEVLVTQRVPGAQYGDSIRIPFYGDVEIAVTEKCRGCNDATPD